MMPKRAPGLEDAKRVPLNMRTSEAMRARLEAEAKLSGRSLSQEVEFCVEQYHFVKDEIDLLRKPVVQMIAMALKQAEINSGKSWYEDEVTAQAFRNSVTSIVDLLFPFKTLSNLVARKGRVEDVLDLADAAILAQDAIDGMNNHETTKVRERIQLLIERTNSAWDGDKRTHVLRDEPSE